MTRLRRCGRPAVAGRRAAYATAAALVVGGMIAGTVARPPRAEARRNAADLGSGAPAPPVGSHSVRIDVRGAVALVTVVRTVPAPGPGRASETILDIALPERSALLDAELFTGKRFERVESRRADDARDAYVASLRAMGLEAGEVPFDDETRFRIRIAAGRDRPPANLQIRYSFSTILEARGDRCRLSFPPAPEASPVPASVTVRAEPRGAIGEIAIGGASRPVPAGGPAIAEATVSTRSRWSVTLTLAPARADRLAPRLDALTSVAATPPNGSAVAYALGASSGGGERREIPERALFLVDRSRSVGPAGLAAERDVARRILDALPPATRFDVLFFDRGQKRLFPLARAATREAIGTLEDEMVPARLANGTDLAAVLREAGALLRREASAFGPQLLLVVLTDGALPAPGAGTKLPDLLGALPGIEVMTAVLSVRADDDRRVGAEQRRLLRQLAMAAPLGGVEREIRAGDLAGAVPAVLDVLRGGGELYTVELAARGASLPLAEVLAPADGASGVVALAAKAARPLRLSVTTRGQERSVSTRPVAVAASWLAPHLDPAAAARPREMRLLAGASTTALIEPVVHPAEPPPAPGVHGFMERSVVRNALSLAFTPRARACYLNRPSSTPAERDLAGRVRLALDLVRGEVGAVRVEGSTLARPAIETCLREAAFGLEVPRAYRNDDPVTAVLNLVFRPRNPQEKRGAISDPGVAEQMDLLIEEALEAMREEGAPAPAAAGPPPGAPPETTDRAPPPLGR